MTKPDLKALQESADKNRALYTYDSPNKTLLESFARPSSGVDTNMEIRIDCPEFTSLCPLTGQPDFANIVIEYIPDALCVESKSLKLYLLTFRQHGAFHEQVVKTICDDLAELLQPRILSVTGEFTPRGGISFWPTATYVADE